MLNQYSNFWFDDKNSSLVDDFLGIDEKKKGKDLIALAGYRRAISNFVNIVTGKITGWYNGGPSGSTIGDTGIRLTVSNIEVTGAATGFTTDYGFVYGFSGTGGTGGVTGAGFGGTYGFTGSMASYLISSIPILFLTLIL